MKALLAILILTLPLNLPQHAEAAATPLLVFLGDSLTAGYGLDATEAYPTIVDKKLHAEGLQVRVVNAGVSGDTSSGGLRRLGWLLKQKPDYVVVALGANDMLRGLPPQETEKNLDGILTEISAAGAQPILFGMKATPNLGETYRRAFDGIYSRIAKRRHIPFLPFFIQDVAGQRSLNQADGLHPTAEGQKLVADRVEQFLLPLLRKGHS